MSLDNMLILRRSRVELQVQESRIYRGMDMHGPTCRERKNTRYGKELHRMLLNITSAIRV